MRVLTFFVATCALAACNPMAVIDSATNRAARSVIVTVLAQELPAPVAEQAANCIVETATPAELRAIAADIGVMAGTQTVANIRNLALRPQAVECFAKASVPALSGAL